jgi:RNA polymerase sigma-70 factor, ECF subfamily
MPPTTSGDLTRTLARLYRSESGRILATLVRLLGDLDLAEEAMHEAFAAALDITLLYDRLIRIQPSAVVELNRAVAVAMFEGPEQGLHLIDGLLARDELATYHLAHSARADLCRRLGRFPEARVSYEKAPALAPQGPEHRFLAGRLRELK